MREIKFRAWSNNLKKMFYDNYMFENNNSTTWQQFTRVDGIMFCETDSLNAELMQYTGRKDINAKEIYDGDILKHHGIVKWCNEDHRWIAIDLNWNDKREVHELDYLTSPFDVIGNIYENPELLK